ncbi:Uncharacterised protein [Mycobacteroides abscessus subsp. abscessus]|nr:Uncharacterised protein [Mycobacteroides abscessus subsp. abscessus]
MRLGLDLARLGDGSGADGVIGRLVDQDERAAVPAVGIGIGYHHRTGAQGDRADVVERQLDRPVQLVECLRVKAGVQSLNRGPHRPGALLECQSIARA